MDAGENTTIVKYNGDKVADAGNSFGGKRVKNKL